MRKHGLWPFKCHSKVKWLWSEKFFFIIGTTYPIRVVCTRNSGLWTLDNWKTPQQIQSWQLSLLPNQPKWFVFRYVAIDNLKRGDNIGPTSIIAHTSVPFAMDRIDETPENLKPDLMSSLQKMFPTWTTPSHVKCHKWRFSQVWLKK